MMSDKDNLAETAQYYDTHDIFRGHAGRGVDPP